MNANIKESIDIKESIAKKGGCFYFVFVVQHSDIMRCFFYTDESTCKAQVRSSGRPDSYFCFVCVVFWRGERGRKVIRWRGHDTEKCRQKKSRSAILSFRFSGSHEFFILSSTLPFVDTGDSKVHG